MLDLYSFLHENFLLEISDFIGRIENFDYSQLSKRLEENSCLSTAQRKWLNQVIAERNKMLINLFKEREG